MTQFDTCLVFTLGEEGGFVRNAADPGGATNRGITLAILRAWRRDEGAAAPTVADIQNLHQDEAAAIYGAWFWNVVRGEQLGPGVNLAVFDFGVTASPRRSAVLLQEAVGAAPDGSVGPETLGLVGIARSVEGGAGKLITKLHAAQDAYYKRLPTFHTFGRGWLARSERRCSSALAMVAAAAPASVASDADNSADDLNAEELALVGG